MGQIKALSRQAYASPDPMPPLYQHCDDIAELIDQLEQKGQSVAALENEYIQLIIALAEAQEAFSQARHMAGVS